MADVVQGDRRSETQVQYHRRRVEDLKTIRNPYEPTWSDLAKFFNPSRLRLQSLDERSVSRKAIIDSTGTFALRTLASGMHSGITSPARPWFKLMTGDRELREFGEVKLWIDYVEQRIREVMAASNIYTAFHQGYYDQGLFGQSCGLLVEGDATLVRMIQMVHGRFWLARNEEGRADTLYRQMRWSTEKIVRRFGLDAVSNTVRTAWDRGKYDQRFDIWHAVEPRHDRDTNKIDAKNKPFLSNYWEDLNSNEGKMLLESGFDENPIIAPAWELHGDDNYGSSPAMDVLGDVKMLQREQADKLEAIAKKVKPPMQGPTSLKGNPASLLPNAITYVDDPQGKGFRPAMEVNFSVSELWEDIRETKENIRTGMFADLFLMLANMEGVQPRNQLEISERKEEKLLALGPVLENIYNGQLEPSIDRIYAMLNRAGQLPPPPQDVRDQPLKVEYISVLAQAQKAVATGAIERVIGFAGNLVAVRPDVVDKIDFDQAIDEYADMVGASPKIIVPDDKVKEARDARAKQQQAAQSAEMAKTIAPAISSGAQAAKVLSEASALPGGNDLLSKLGIGGA